MNHVPPDGLVGPLNAFVQQLFRAHGVESSVQGDWLSFPETGLRMNAQIVREIDNPKALILQLDVRIQLTSERTLIESFGGWGPDLDTAVKQALEQFVSGTFHVLLSAFFGRAVKDHAETEIKVIGDRPRQIISGLITRIGQIPETTPGQPDMRWFLEFRHRLEAKPLTPGTHWLRLYYAQFQERQLECEVLLDNEPWSDLQVEMSRIDWPKSKDYYSVRWFLVIREAPEDAARE